MDSVIAKKRKALRQIRIFFIFYETEIHPFKATAGSILSPLEHIGCGNSVSTFSINLTHATSPKNNVNYGAISP